MKILHLTLKKRWFDLIASGEKKEEYREDKEYWRTRLMDFDFVSRNSFMPFKKYNGYKHYDIIRFTNGYGKDAPTMDVEFKGVKAGGNGNPEWGYTEPCFIIKLGKILTNSTR